MEVLTQTKTETATKTVVIVATGAVMGLIAAAFVYGGMNDHQTTPLAQRATGAIFVELEKPALSATDTLLILP